MTDNRGEQNTPPAAPGEGRSEPELIRAVPLRHPWRWTAAAVILVLAGLFVWGAVTNDAYRWDTYARYLFDKRIVLAAGYTLLLTVTSMAIAIVLGVTFAVMRMSDNPVMRYVAWVYLWIFRGTPVYLQLFLWGMVGSIYPVVHLGIPWGPTFVEFVTQNWTNALILAIIGLALNESAYMAEIVRAGIDSVPEGQREASTALGMSWRQTTIRTVLPQAMRVIIPPTGNEVISMLKTTSLVTAIPFTLELTGRARDISAANYQPIPLLIVAATWYLAVTSILMVGQYYLERYYSRGATRKLTAKQLRALADAEGVPPRNIEITDEPQGGAR
ncbi:amino acid ABC transporter permease [Dietzia timorensis]|uniref:Putative amino-acid ABC transporter permease protein n YckA n=1 Tax=Dietzia timorensis TaxID=499555 RepID=A0A173LL52_9ACTN|nr:amino acid ABC transporter permease [Dietzia timorensis]ANI92238.1 putative amino-acid ABC transporter permease protein n YckA [Dietzia timorensis]